MLHGRGFLPGRASSTDAGIFCAAAGEVSAQAFGQCTELRGLSLIWVSATGLEPVPTLTQSIRASVKALQAPPARAGALLPEPARGGKRESTPDSH